MVNKTLKLFNEFTRSEKFSGIILIACTLFSLLLANSIWGESYAHFWHYPIGNQPIEYWINDGLMTLFFLLIGLELEREIYIGKLSRLKNALLPIFAAIGGMLIPAGIYLLLNYNTPTQSGAGIPMATDIAFSLAILSILGKRVPLSLKVFLTALAIIDDLGAILIIAVFYSKQLIWSNLLIALSLFGLLLILNRLKVKSLILYLIGGFFMWVFMLNSGVHATVTGVLLAFAIPFEDGKENSISYKLQHSLHNPIAFLILPLFALANTAIKLSSNLDQALTQKYTLGIALGLLLGKPLGIWLFSYISVRLKISKLPKEINWKIILGTSFFGGIGFTMSIFITLLAFTDKEHIDNSKIVILIASLLSALFGLIYLHFTLKKKNI